MTPQQKALRAMVLRRTEVRVPRSYGGYPSLPPSWGIEHYFDVSTDEMVYVLYMRKPIWETA